MNIKSFRLSCTVQRQYSSCSWKLCSYKPRKGKESFVSNKSVDINVPSEFIRNIGIIAHIDAGKTTLTERLLYLAGTTKFMGNVDSGNTVTDFMDLERERGITIQSAAITLFWRKHRINLIDTPGHVDFTLEVERCLRVLDSAVTVLDASAGVQAQTMTVWRQAKKFRIPSIFFINKMDKQTANFKKSIDSITEKLHLKQPINVTVPCSTKNGRFSGVVDTLNKRYLNCDLGDEARWTDLKENCPQFEQMMFARDEMLSKLAEMDDQFAETLLQTSNEDSVLNVGASNVIRRLTLTQEIVPIVCGSALRCVQSVSPVLDMVVSCLPCPTEKNNSVSKVFGDDMSALVFKIGHDKRHGQLTYARIYTGEIKNVGSLYNANKRTTENKFSVHIPHSDQLQPTPFVKAGNIAVLTGLKSTVTGDTLLASERVAELAMKRRKKLSEEISDAVDFSSDYSEKTAGLIQSVLLSGVETPDPVYFCTVEAPSEASNVEFENALQELAVEDPSLRVRTDPDLGQTIIGAMGELHIEVIKNRLQHDYGMNVFIGPLQVAYREVIENKVEHTVTLSAVFGENGIKHDCKITFVVIPKPDSGKFKQVVVLFNADSEYASIGLRENWMNAINEGCANALHTGPVAGFNVYGVTIVLTDFVVSGGRINPAVISAAASKCVKEALHMAGAHLVEPIMNVEVVTTSETHKNSVLNEIYKRRGVLLNSGADCIGDTYLIRCNMPLADLQGFSKNARILTSGHASIHMELGGYQDVPEQKQQEIVSSVKVGHR